MFVKSKTTMVGSDVIDLEYWNIYFIVSIS